MDAEGNVIASAASFSEDLVIVDTETGAGDQHATFRGDCEAVYEALVLVTRDYIRKCGFGSVLIGLSGGVDSSLTAVIAVDAVGKENVRGVAMPGPFSSDHSVNDARALAERLGIQFDIVSISPAYHEMLATLAPVFEGREADVTEENIQARLRGLTLMSLSNKFGAMVLTTGNKSEIAVGYCTLYGDMCGGLAVISDVPKTMVYSLSRVANARHDDAIPGIGVRETAVGGIKAGPERQRLAPALRHPRQHPPDVHRGELRGQRRSRRHCRSRLSWFRM